MSKATINLIGTLRDVVGYSSAQVEINGKATFNEFTKLADKQYGGNMRQCILDQDTGDISQAIVIFVNNYNLQQLQGLNTPIRNGDEIIIMSVTAGG